MTPGPRSDKGGSQPENQRKRSEIRGPRRALIGVLGSAAVGAMAVGLMLVVRAEGGLVRLPADLLAASPFPSFRAIGLLLAIVGGTQAVAATLLVRHHARARHVATAAGAIVLLLGAILGMTMTRISWLQLALLGLGFLELLLVAGSTPRKPARFKHRLGRR